MKGLIKKDQNLIQAENMGLAVQYHVKRNDVNAAGAVASLAAHHAFTARPDLYGDEPFDQTMERLMREAALYIRHETSDNLCTEKGFIEKACQQGHALPFLAIKAYSLQMKAFRAGKRVEYVDGITASGKKVIAYFDVYNNCGSGIEQVKPQPEPKYDVVKNIIEYEQGDLGHEETVELFQYLINNGMAWTLQGHYGRMAMQLIANGYCTAKA